MQLHGQLLSADTYSSVKHQILELKSIAVFDTLSACTCVYQLAYVICTFEGQGASLYSNYISVFDCSSQ